MSTKEVFEDLKEFILSERGKYRFDLTEDHSLQDDLGIYGMDAVEFIVNFGDRYKIDVSRFDAEKYFKPEGFDSSHRIYPKLTIGTLLSSISNGGLK